VLNDDFVVGHIGLVPAHLPRSHSLQHAHAPSAVTVLSVDAIFESIRPNILQDSVVTLFRCDDVCNNLFIADFLLSVTLKELKKWSYFVEISTRVYSLLF